MRRFLIIITLFSLACSNKNEIKKPEKLIEKEQMENILYDLALLQSVKSYYPLKLGSEKINSKTYIYKKYNIDSLQFVENNRYYSADIETYKKMFTNITERIKNEKSTIDTLLIREQKKLAKKIQDSIAKSSKSK